MDSELAIRFMAVAVGVGISFASFGGFCLTMQFLDKRSDKKLREELAEKDKKMREWIVMTDPNGLIEFEKGIDYSPSQGVPQIEGCRIDR